MCHIMFLLFHAHPKCNFLNFSELKPTQNELWERIDRTGISIAKDTYINNNKTRKSS